jgi:hypothetical protein
MTASFFSPPYPDRSMSSDKNKNPAFARRPRKPRALGVSGALRYFNGRFPRVGGRRYRYPSPDQHAAWTALLNKARMAEYRERLAAYEGRPPPREPNRNKYYHVLHNCRRVDRWKRSVRTRHRRLHGLQPGDPRVVHHRDPRTMAFAQSVVLDHCQHQRAHGKVCERDRGRGRGRAR